MILRRVVVRQRRHLRLHRLERIRVQARRMGEVRLEQDVVLADRLDQIRQLVAAFSNQKVA